MINYHQWLLAARSTQWCELKWLIFSIQVFTLLLSVLDNTPRCFRDACQPTSLLLPANVVHKMCTTVEKQINKTDGWSGWKWAGSLHRSYCFCFFFYYLTIYLHSYQCIFPTDILTSKYIPEIWHHQTDSQIRVSLEPLSSVSISKGRYQWALTKMPLDATGSTYNQSENQKVWHIGSRYLGCLWKCLNGAPMGRFSVQS